VDTVLDIGAGTGSITRELAKYCQHVIAIEKDPDLIEQLTQTIRGLPNVELIAGDFLHVELPAYPYKVFANIPFGLTAEIITKLTGLQHSPLSSHLVVQIEAAHKYIGLPRESMCALLLKPWFRVSIAHYFNRWDFSPVPSVDSVLLRIDRRQQPLLSPASRTLYRDFVVYCFVHGHQLCATLERFVEPQTMAAIASTLAISRSVTPSAIDFEIWLCLFSEFVQHGSRSARQLIAGSERRLKEQQSRLPKEYHAQKHQRW
jgi:23S rRNA (adenine-N6)-dimethyltransferase